MKKWSAVFASSRLKPNALESRIAATTSQLDDRHRAAGPRAGSQHRRHEHERQVVDDVVEPRAVEERRALLDAGEPRQQPVDRVDHRGAASQRKAASQDQPSMIASSAMKARRAPLAVRA